MRVTELWRYPVKSMLGERCDHMTVDRRVVVGDRRYAVYDSDGKIGSGKNTRRFRRIDGLLDFSARYVDDVAVVVFPDGSEMSAGDPHIDAALSDALGRPVRLVAEGAVSHLDAGAVHIVTGAAMGALGRALPGTAVDARRFRPNVVIAADGDGAPERGWIGATATIGAARLAIADETERCVMVTFAQSELAAAPEVLRGVARRGAALFGVYAEVLDPGVIRNGDPMVLDAR